MQLTQLWKAADIAAVNLAAPASIAFVPGAVAPVETAGAFSVGGTYT